MPPATREALKVLAERESVRRDLIHNTDLARIALAPGSSQTSLQVPRDAAKAFYCAARSLEHRSDNRYSDVVGYDRTTVALSNGGYLNANIVWDLVGNWWIAAQVCCQHSA